MGDVYLSFKRRRYNELLFGFVRLIQSRKGSKTRDIEVLRDCKISVKMTEYPWGFIKGENKK